MSTIEALVYRFAFDLARRTAVRVKIVVALVMQPIRFDSSISTRCKLNRPGFRGGSLL